MLTEPQTPTCLAEPAASEATDLERLHEAARELERAGDWAAALMAYESVLVRTERAGAEPDPRLFIKIGDLLVKTDCPGVAIGMFERAAACFAASGNHQSVIALGIKVLRTDRKRTDVFVRFAKLLLQHGYVEEARLVLVDYAERAWARRALRTLKRLESAPADEVLRTLQRLILAVEDAFATGETHGEITVGSGSFAGPHASDPVGAAETERPNEPHDRAAFEAIRPRHRGISSRFPGRAAPREALAGPHSRWPRAAALPAGAPTAVMMPERALPPAVPVDSRRPTTRDHLRAAMSIVRDLVRRLRGVTPPSWATIPVPRWTLGAVFVSTILILAGPRTYERLSRPEPDGRAPVATVGVTLNDASAPAEPVDPTPVYTAGGFRAIQDTAITPLRWEPHLVELPIAFTPPGETLVADSLIQPE